METYNPNNGSSSKTKTVVIPLVIAALLVLTLLGVYLTQGARNDDIQRPTSNESSSAISDEATDTQQSSEENTEHSNGSFTKVGSYQSPGGTEEIEVTVTLQDDVVTDATVISRAENPNSKAYQSRFIRSYKQYVIGKNIDDIKLDTVGGSSLTPIGFNEALEKIKADAKA